MNDEAPTVLEAPHCGLEGGRAAPRQKPTARNRRMGRKAGTTSHKGRLATADGGGQEAPPTTTPVSALTWTSAAQRNRQLKVWRRAVFARFGEHARCVRVACVLMDLFNIKKGYAFPTNGYLAAETNLWENKLRETLLILENGGAIIRANVINLTTGQNQRVIYPATAIIPRPALGQGEGAPPWGRGGEPQQPGHQNLKRIPHIQSSQIALAKAESTRRDERKRHGEGGPSSASPHSMPRPAPQEGYPRSGANSDREPLPSTQQEAREVGNEAAGHGGGGMALDRTEAMRTIEVEDEEWWTL
jgi:hypothetical protein